MSLTTTMAMATLTPRGRWSTPRSERRTERLPAHHALRGRLAVILEEAGTLHLDDRSRWTELTDAARTTIRDLVASGQVPDHLEVRDGEPPVVVRRTIAAAWRHARRVGAE